MLRVTDGFISDSTHNRNKGVVSAVSIVAAVPGRRLHDNKHCVSGSDKAPVWLLLAFPSQLGVLSCPLQLSRSFCLQNAQRAYQLKAGIWGAACE